MACLSAIESKHESIFDKIDSCLNCSMLLHRRTRLNEKKFSSIGSYCCISHDFVQTNI